MAKSRTVFLCQACGYESPKWLGRCPGCNEWNSFVEEKAPAGPGASSDGELSGGRPVAISRVELSAEERWPAGFPELDRVLGGGVVPGSLVLVGGDPGIGKSTLLLQVSESLARLGQTVLYVSGEESARQIRMRADRLGTLSDRLLVVSETNLESIEGHLRSVAPAVAVIDSIQTIYDPELASAPGGVSQVRECAGRLLRIAKTDGIAIFLVGHVNKEGSLAGPRVLEHAVDAVLYFEGERHQSYRVLRAVKNRFGSTNEIGIFEMRERGLIEVPNPSQVFLAERPVGVSGSVVVAGMEGTRPILAELQALVSPAAFGTARRTATGIDYNRVLLIMAVLEKRCGLNLASQDAYLKLAGGVRTDEPAMDLGVAVAIASSFRDVPADPGTVVFGEVGLAGEVRAVGRGEQRIREAERLGFKRCVAPVSAVPPAAGARSGAADAAVARASGIEIIGVASLEGALEAVLDRGDSAARPFNSNPGF